MKTDQWLIDTQNFLQNVKLSFIVLEPVNNQTDSKHLQSYNIDPL